MIDFTRYEGESFDTLAEMYGIPKVEAIKQYAAFKALRRIEETQQERTQ